MNVTKVNNQQSFNGTASVFYKKGESVCKLVDQFPTALAEDSLSKKLVKQIGTETDEKGVVAAESVQPLINLISKITGVEVKSKSEYYTLESANNAIKLRSIDSPKELNIVWNA